MNLGDIGARLWDDAKSTPAYLSELMRVARHAGIQNAWELDKKVTTMKRHPLLEEPIYGRLRMHAHVKDKEVEGFSVDRDGTYMWSQRDRTFERLPPPFFGGSTGYNPDSVQPPTPYESGQ